MIELENGFQLLINALIETIGKEQVEKHVEEYFSNEAGINIMNEITLGESKGWANPEQQLKFLNYAANRIDLVKKGFEWVVVLSK